MSCPHGESPSSMGHLSFPGAAGPPEIIEGLLASYRHSSTRSPAKRDAGASAILDNRSDLEPNGAEKTQKVLDRAGGVMNFDGKILGHAKKLTSGLAQEKFAALDIAL